MKFRLLCAVSSSHLSESRKEPEHDCCGNYFHFPGLGGGGGWGVGWWWGNSALAKRPILAKHPVVNCRTKWETAHVSRKQSGSRKLVQISQKRSYPHRRNRHEATKFSQQQQHTQKNKKKERKQILWNNSVLMETVRISLKQTKPLAEAAQQPGLAKQSQMTT